MALYTLAPAVKRQFLDASGNPLSGGLLYIVSAGGSYPTDAVATYQTSSGTLHANPIVLDSAGRISGSSELYFVPGQSYKFILHDSADGLVYTQDNVGAVPPSTVNVDFQGIAGVALSVNDVVYLSKGDGGLNAGQWYKTNSDLAYSSSDAITVGMVPSAIAQGATGTIRTEGEITVPGTLTPGAAYYIGPTAGSLTATIPANTRLVGQAQSATSIVIAPNPPVTGLDILQIESLLG